MSTVGLGGSIVWDYDQAKEVNVDQFVGFVDGVEVATVASDQREMPLQDMVTTPGIKQIGLAARNAMGDSSRAQIVANVVTGVPDAPTNLRLSTPAS